ncbi:phage tail sheath C-terminal domain-containing protein [Falsiroseomonas sp.]|uniref:phage tail sheath family protein n=1 Tax=Falsiroseomonas sp. TaxID=2870721 RepID=UPI002715EA94|nr:phage tail sheath C-terminal domain-containing protein [Falsiroseomonas sp.]MDO9499328.1 phage tail sheath subtilisin-like domain-containing protein [Falsiroseomonas sp.]
MPVNPTYPGVYIQEVSSGVRTISGVATSVTAFVGRAKRGPVGEPTACFNFGEFNRRFGGLWTEGPLSYAVDDFFANGGGQALTVRLFKPGAGDGVATLTIGNLKLRAANPGAWGNTLTGRVLWPEDKAAAEAVAGPLGLTENDLFDLVVEDSGTGRVETFRNLAVASGAGARRVDRVLQEGSSLVRLAKLADGSPDLPAALPPATPEPFPKGTGGDDGVALAPADYLGAQDRKTGLHALRKADLFNLLCVPPDTRGGTLDVSVRDKAAEICAELRALYIMDPPAGWDADPDTAAAKAKADVIGGAPVLSSLKNGSNAALFFPRLRKRDPLRGGQMDVFPPCGAVAGVMARTDAERGVWKAPAGIAAGIAGAEELTVKLTDSENGLLNPVAVNCLRSFPVVGRVVWGSRTLKGSDQLADDYKYIPVRRLALFIEESLYRGTQWVVFEPNDEPLWAQIRLSVGAFMQRLFRQGAFQGASPRDAYLVKCDGETTTQDDINRGIVNILVGFAPLQPAEFVVISIQQIRSA